MVGGSLGQRLSALKEAADQLVERVTMFRLSVQNCDFPLVDLVTVLYSCEDPVLRPLAPSQKAIVVGT